MRESTVMGKTKDRILEASQDVNIGGLCGQRRGRGGERRLAVEAGAG